MPLLFVIFGFKFSFYTNDHYPIHVHVRKGGCTAKVDVETLEVENHGFTSRDIKKIRSVILEFKEEIIEAWERIFGE